MAVMRWFERKRVKALIRRRDESSSAITCDACSAAHQEQSLRSNHFICTVCGQHLRMPVDERIALLMDDGTWERWSGGVYPIDTLGFDARNSYAEKLAANQERSGRPDAVEAGGGQLEGERVALVVMDYGFIGGSMGSAVGEEFARAAEKAAAEDRSLVVVTASGGARMHEGALSLMQMAKTTVALEALAVRRLPFISVLTNPTTGGVTASFATLGDLVIAEPKSLIGFAGPRVVQQTIRQDLPEGFQRAEFLLEHGMLDAIVKRPQLKGRIAAYLRLLRGGKPDFQVSNQTRIRPVLERQGLEVP